MESWRIWTARMFATACLGLGVIGLIVGFADKTWKLGVVGWFTGGILLGLVGLLLMLDGYAAHRRGHRT